MHKVADVTLAFWIVKIAATTLGETGGDALSMSLRLGYALSTAIFGALLVVAVAAQVTARSFNAWLYWLVIVATTTAGTTLSDFLDRTAGLGYLRASALLFGLVLAMLAAWRRALGTVSVSAISSRKAECFYWATIFLANTLGTALGDFTASGAGLGFEGGALVFGAALALLAAAYFLTALSHTLLFWSAFILTRPLGATLGDLLTKPRADGGFDLGRIAASAALASFMALCIFASARRRPLAS